VWTKTSRAASRVTKGDQQERNNYAHLVQKKGRYGKGGEGVSIMKRGKNPGKERKTSSDPIDWFTCFAAEGASYSEGGGSKNKACYSSEI